MTADPRELFSFTWRAFEKHKQELSDWKTSEYSDTCCTAFMMAISTVNVEDPFLLQVSRTAMVANIIHPLSLQISELQHSPMLDFSPKSQLLYVLDTCTKSLSIAEQQIVDYVKSPIVQHYRKNQQQQIVTSLSEYTGNIFSGKIDSFAYRCGKMEECFENCRMSFDAILNNAVKKVLHPQNTKEKNDEYLFSLPTPKVFPSAQASGVVAQRLEQHIAAFDALNVQMENILQQPIQIQHLQPFSTVTIPELAQLHTSPSKLLQGKRVRAVDDLVWRVDLLGGMLDEALGFGLREKLIWRAISKVAQQYQNTLEALVPAALEAWKLPPAWTLADVENAVRDRAKLDEADTQWLIGAIRFECRVDSIAADLRHILTANGVESEAGQPVNPDSLADVCRQFLEAHPKADRQALEIALKRGFELGKDESLAELQEINEERRPNAV